MRKISIFIFIVLCFSCKKKTVPQLPEVAQLIAPQNNSECTTGVDSSPLTSMVEFRWKQATNADTYELRVTNLNTNRAQSISTKSLSAKLPLEKGDLYSWIVHTKNVGVLQTATSETWRFYNSGFESSYAPFPAEILMPKLGESIFRDTNNEVTLSWSGADIDNDIASYELYFSTEKPPTNLITTITNGATNQKVAVEQNKVYYWKVITKDAEGNTSDSGIFDFRVR